jgi:lysophospholipase L1-like esterase
MTRTIRTGGWTVAMTLAVCAAVTGARAGADNRKTPVGKWERHYYDRLARFEKENSAARNIVLVGSSHIERFDTARHFPGRRVVNRGIAADRIGIDERGVLHRLEASVFDCNPGFVVLENGVNDLGELWRHGTPSIAEIDACYRRVVKEIRTRRPDVPLVIVGLFPTRGEYAELVPMIVEFNSRLGRIAADFGCPFMDAYQAFADSAGLLREDYSQDGLHLNAAGYDVWARMIRDVLPPDVGLMDPAPPSTSGKP